MSSATAIPAPDVIARHIDDVAGRYACYPGVAQFRSGFGDASFVEALRASNGDPIPAKLSLHVGVPDRFGLHAVGGTRDEHGNAPTRPEAYLHRLVRQIATIGRWCDRDRDVVQLTLSPGTTEFFDADHIAEVVDSLSRNFHFSNSPDRDFVATVSPRAMSHAYLRGLVDIGCNRAGFAAGYAFGPADETRTSAPPSAEVVMRCREAGFRNVRVDVVFGAVHEDIDAFRAHLAALVEAAPDVVALRDFAHLPESFSPVRGRAHDASVRAHMLCRAWHALHDAGYTHLGMGVFAVPGDPLLRARREGRLHRNALGFGVHGATDLIGFGVGAIHQTGTAYGRTTPHLHAWESAIDDGRIGIETGLNLSLDDRIRATVIESILCADTLDLSALSARFAIDVGACFAAAFDRLAALANDGLLTFDTRDLTLTPAGHLLSRVVAACFDASLSDDRHMGRVRHLGTS